MIICFHLNAHGVNEPRNRPINDYSETRHPAVAAILLISGIEKGPRYANSEVLHQDTIISRNAIGILSCLEIFVKVASKTTGRIKQDMTESKIISLHGGLR